MIPMYHIGGSGHLPTPGGCATGAADSLRWGSGRPRGLEPTGSGLGHTVLPLGAGRECQAVARAIRKSEVAVLASGHAVEQIRRRPVDPLGEEAVRERAQDLERELVHDMG